MVFNISYSQTISGKIISEDEPNGLPFVNVKIQDSQIGTITDLEGNFSINIQAGNHNLIFTCVSYHSDTLKIDATKDVIIKHKLISNDFQIGDVVIQAKSNKENDKALLVERKESNEITQNIGSKELQRAGTSNVSEGLTKVTGISTQSNYIYIRGMGDRYNNSYINSLPLSSIDPDSKMMPMDIFPNQIIKNINVNKSYNVNEYGDFSGGYIDLKTKDYPSEFLLKLELGSDFNSQSLIKFGTFDNANFNPLQKNPFNYNGNLSFGNFFEKKNHRFGFLLNGYQKTQNRFEFGNLKTTNAQGVERINYKFDNYKERKDYSGLVSLFYGYKNHNFNFNSIYLNSNSNSFRETEGYHFDYSDSIYTRRYTPFERMLFINQFLGESKFKKFGFNYGVSYSEVSSSENNRRQLVYLHNKGIYRINDIDILDNHKFYSYLKESDLSGKFNSYFEIKQIKFDLGFDYRDKKRYFDYDQFIYNFIDPYLMGNVNNPDDKIESNSEIVEVVNPASRYDANLNISSLYLLTNFNKNKLSLNLGTRLEKSLQSIRYKDQQQPLFQRTNILNNTNLLGSINIKYSLNNENLLRLTFSNTISRPSFREVAPFEYTEVFAGIKTVGNPTLINSNNYNLDFRYERFNDKFGLFSITLFSKYIQTPIEKTMLATSSGQLQSFANANSAQVYGSEIEWVKNIEINQNNIIRLNSNLTFLKSLVEVEKTAGTIQTNDRRPLQGASPILMNLDVSYNKKFKNVDSYLTLSFNRFGSRLWSVGIQGLGDVYENAINTLNLTFRNTINEKIGVNLSLNNILNPEYKTTQQTLKGDVVLNQYRTGLNFGCSLSYNF